MDAESSYESDISESWSLIDINLNEEQLNATDEPPTVENSCLPEIKNKKLKKINETEIQDFVRKFKESDDTDFNRISDSDSDSFFKKRDVESCSRTDGVQPPENLDDDDDVKNDSGDAESIEILDMDGNYQDSEVDKLDVCGIDHYDFATYQSDDEGSSDGRAHNENRTNSSTVIKRKRRRVSKDLEDTVNCVYSETKRSASTTEAKRTSDKFNKAHNHPVYKHYRNNVANTVLNLSVGVIFAGVACIAIGHFLGVQDAAETAVELVGTLKKLQVENAALQSSMVHLKKALLTLETNSKLELPSTPQLHNKVSREETAKVDPSKTQTQADLNNAALSEIRSSLNSIEWLSKVQSNLKKGTDTEKTEIDANVFGKQIHDQLNLLKERNKEGSKLSEDADLLLVLKKLLVVLKKIMSKLSSSHDNIEDMHERLTKLKHIINNRLSKFFRDSSGRGQHEDRIPVTELDLKTMQWSPNNKIRWNPDKNSESRILYKFPQPQKYYETERKIESINETHLETTNSSSSLKTDGYEKARGVRKNKKKRNKENEYSKKKEKKLGRKTPKKEKDKKGDKKRKRLVNRSVRVADNFGKGLEKKNKFFESKYLNSFNETDISQKKKVEKREKFKGRFKKTKNSKLKKVLYTKLKKDYLKKNKHSPFCSDLQCFNLTGYWIFKWADGREEFRKHQTLGDWQFDRAKARKNVRDVDLNNNWLFERAKARKELRNEDLTGNWQFKRALARESNRNDDRSQREKFTRYSGKEFFQERFSWI